MAAIRVLQILLGTAAVAFIFIAARAWFAERAAWIAAIFAGLTGLFTFYEMLLIPAAFDPFLTAAALAALAPGLGGRRTQRRPARWLKPWLLVRDRRRSPFAASRWNRPVLSARAAECDFYIGNNAAADGTYRPSPASPPTICTSGDPTPGRRRGCHRTPAGRAGNVRRISTGSAGAG